MAIPKLLDIFRKLVSVLTMWLTMCCGSFRLVSNYTVHAGDYTYYCKDMTWMTLATYTLELDWSLALCFE